MDHSQDDPRELQSGGWSRWWPNSPCWYPWTFSELDVRPNQHWPEVGSFTCAASQSGIRGSGYHGHSENRSYSSPPSCGGCGSRIGRADSLVPAGPAAPVQAGQSSQGIGPAEALQGPDHLELKRLAEVVNSLKSELDGSKGSKKKKKDKKKKSKKSRSRSSDHKKRKSKKRSSSSTSSSSSGRSSSSSSFVKWKMEGRSKDVTAVSMGKVDAKKFKKRADLLIFAAKHPGALTANFINALRQKLMRGGILRTSQLRDIEMTEFITTGAAGLKEVRDRQEALTILQAMDLVNKREVAKAMDVLSMRITALLEAKSSGGSWDKASRKELIPEDGGSLAPSGLTGLV